MYEITGRAVRSVLVSNKLRMRPGDFGPIYAETVLGRFPVEPWNTFSNLIFLLIILVYAWRTRLCFSRFRFIVGALPILALGFVGGTLFHATRRHSIWLFMDFVPIFILAIMAATYFWSRLVRSRVLIILGGVGPTIIVRLIAWALDLPRHFSISLGYGALALTILIPAFLSARGRPMRELALLVGAFLAIGIGLAFRVGDQTWGRELLPMGTHFLWHLFGGISVFLLIEYIFRTGSDGA